MSRRVRVEEERAKQLLLEQADEVDKLQVLHEKIFGPLVWRTLHSGIRIEDLSPPRYEEALEIIENNYPQEDVVFRNSKFSEEPESQRSFRDRLHYNMKDNSSIIAIDERNDEIMAGILLLKTIKRSNFGRVFSRSMLAEGKAYHSIMDFMNYISRKSDIFEAYDCDAYLRYYLVCIRPEYRKKGLGFQLMNVGLDIARHFNLPIVMGIFNCFKMQKLAKRLGMQTLYEISYVNWVDKAGELLFCNPGAGNYTCATMAAITPPPPEPPPPPPPTIEELEARGKQTRGDKRKAIAKENLKKK